MPETILQFGTGKFLRCFVDLFVHETNAARGGDDRVVVVQSTGGRRAEAINRQRGRFHAAIRGLAAGERVDRLVEVRSVGRALEADRQWEEVLEAARSPALAAIVSNVTEAGYALADAGPPEKDPPRSFPAKLLAVLRARKEAGQPGLAILPCELLDRNGRRLRALVRQEAGRRGMTETATEDLLRAQHWHDTLVDRIVAAPKADDPWAARDPLVAVAEPFALWLIEGDLDVPSLTAHAAVQPVDDVGPFALRKVRVLNGAHTALVSKARPLGIQTVREALEDERVRGWLERLLLDEVVPVLEGRCDDPAGFAQDALERLANPFLDHRLDDIALHHDTKVQTRLHPTLEEYRRRYGRAPRLLAEVAT